MPIARGAIVETRFVDGDSGRAVFKSRQTTLSEIQREALPSFDDYDLVVIADFGHGLLDASALNRRTAGRAHATVAAMAQVNSGNYGYNLPTKYVGADYYALNRTEAELCLHERGLPLDDLVVGSAARLRCDVVSVTDGDNGVAVLRRGERFALPSLSATVVDTIGCGDAYFALSSLAARLNLPPALIALVGSIGAAAMTQRRCNESAVTEQEFMTVGKIVI
jgi:sugar/nucleoside kinase (ribokinase family)